MTRPTRAYRDLLDRFAWAYARRLRTVSVPQRLLRAAHYGSPEEFARECLPTTWAIRWHARDRMYVFERA